MQKTKGEKLLSLLLFSISGLNLFFACANANKTVAQTYYSKAECVMEKESRRVLYESNGEVRLPMASTTKIATAITVLENCETLEREFLIPKAAVGVEGSSVYLKEGDRYSTLDLLYGLMLRSGNDAATALAIHTSGTVEEFCIKMNKIAQKSGAIHTNFRNPHGLPKERHYTTARDLSYITCYALHNSIFEKIVSTQFYEPCGWKNKNKTLKLYPYAIGVKTGYTKEAGRCLVSAAKKEGMTLVCSVLSCPDMYNRSINLLEECFEKYKKVALLEKNTHFEIEIDGKKIICSAKTDFYYPLREEELEHVEIITCADEYIKKPSKENGEKEEICGKVEIYLLKRLIFSSNLYKL